MKSATKTRLESCPEAESFDAARLHHVDFDFTDSKTNYLTHGLHPYPAKFIPQIPDTLIRELSNEGDTVADGCEQRGEGTVQLIAETTTVVADDLVREAVSIEDDLAPQADVEVLERNGQHVLVVQRTQSVGRWRKRAVVANSVEIGKNIHSASLVPQEASKFDLMLALIVPIGGMPA